MEEEKKTKFCSNCGAEIDIKAKICPKCGVEQPIISEKISKLWWLVPLFFGVIGGLVAWLGNRDRNPKTAKRLLIFGIVWAILWVIVPIGLMGITTLVSLKGARTRAKEARIVADIMQARTTAEIMYSERDTYEPLSCDYREMQSLCKDIENQGGKLTILTTTNKYCFYTPLLTEKEYYCVDSEGNAGYTEVSPPCTTLDYLCRGVRRFK